MRRLCSPLLVVVALAAVLAAVPHAACAAAQRTFVASYGLTANTAFNCSLAKPCRAFSEAIGVANPGGEVLVLDSAGYGPVTVTKSVSIIAPPGVHAGISVFSGDGVTIDAGASDVVVLRGLSISGQGGSRGIVLQTAARLRVENCVVSGMGSSGIVHNAAGAEMIVLDTVVRDNAGGGIVVNGDVPSALLDRVHSEHNGGDGFYVAPTPGSLGARATVFDSVLAHNGGKGIWADIVGGATVTILVERSVMAYNGQDGFTATAVPGASADATLTRNAINDNGGHGVWLQGATLGGAASENAVHRNSGNGILVDGGPQSLWISANSVIRNLGGDLKCNSASGYLITLGNNIALTSTFAPPACHIMDTGK